MKHNKKLVYKFQQQPDNLKQRRSDQVGESSATVGQSDGLPGMFENGAFESQVGRLTNRSVLSAQSQALAMEIGQVQGNRYMQTLVNPVSQLTLQRRIFPAKVDKASENKETPPASATEHHNVKAKPTETSSKMITQEVLREAGRDITGPCSAVSIKRYVLAQINLHPEINGSMAVWEETHKSEIQEKLRTKLLKVLGYAKCSRKALGIQNKLIVDEFMEGGPNSDFAWGTNYKALKVKNDPRWVTEKAKQKYFADVIIATLQGLGLGTGSSKDYRTWYLYWQGAGRKSKARYGAIAALEAMKLGKQITPKHPKKTKGEIGQYNIQPELWEKILKPGCIIQSWKNENIAKTLKGEGHSFIFVDYVVSPVEIPPAGVDTWELYDEISGVLLTRYGNAARTYCVQKGETLEAIAQKFGVTAEYLTKQNKDKLKSTQTPTGERKYWFKKFENIIVGEAELRTLMPTKDMKLVGMRIADQKGYVFIAKIAKNSEPRGRWLSTHKVWFASELL